MNLLPITAILMVAFLLTCRIMFHRSFQASPRQADDIRALTTVGVITDPRLLVKSLIVIGIVLAGFITGPLTGVEPSVVALMGAGLLLLITRMEPRRAIADVE